MRSCASGSTVAVGDHTNSRPGAANSAASNSSTNSLIQASTGARPSSSERVFCTSAVARFIWETRACGETEKAKQTRRASQSSKTVLSSGSLVWMKECATAPGTNLARRRLPSSPEK